MIVRRLSSFARRKACRYIQSCLFFGIQLSRRTGTKPIYTLIWEVLYSTLRLVCCQNGQIWLLLATKPFSSEAALSNKRTLMPPIFRVKPIVLFLACKVYTVFRLQYPRHLLLRDMISAQRLHRINKSKTLLSCGI